MPQDLSWLLGSTLSRTFLKCYFEKKPLHISNRPLNYYADVFTPADLTAVIYQSPELVRRNLKTSRMFAGDTYSSSPGPSSTTPLSNWMRETLASGESLLIGDFAQAWLPLGRLVRQVEAVLLNSIEASLFLSPANARGFPIHFDTYDTMVLQIAGEKDWNIYRPSIALPVHAQNHRVDPDDLGEPLLRAKMRPGDLLYMPRGFIHETSTNQTPSMHITLISLPYRWVDLLHDLIDEIGETEEALRRHVPLGPCREIASGGVPKDGVGSGLATALRRIVAKAGIAAPITRHLTQFIDGLTPVGDDPAPPRLADQIEGEQWIARKEGMICQVHEVGHRVVIRFPGGHLRGPARTRSALRFIASAVKPFRLVDVPGPLSQRSKGILVRRLIREGLLELPCD